MENRADRYNRTMNEGGEGYNPHGGNSWNRLQREKAVEALAKRAVAEGWTKAKFDAERKALGL